jgi:predicted nucleotidyltransferase
MIRLSRDRKSLSVGLLHRARAGAAAALRAAGAREVYVFGSASKGKLRPGSDVDLAVSGLPPEVFFRAMGKASRAVGRPVDLVDLDEDSLFTRYLKEEGELKRVG